MDKLYCRFDELAKLDCKLDALAKLRMSSMRDKLRMSSMGLISWISWAVILMS